MDGENITKQDLVEFKTQVFEEMKVLFEEMNIVKLQKELDQIFLRSYKVEKMLNLSPSKLQTMRLKGALPFIKMGGVIFYDKDDVIDFLNKHKRNPH